MLTSSVAGASLVTWKGLDWTVDTHANATVDGDAMGISIPDGNSNPDPDPDNWCVSADLTTLNLNYSSGVWYEFKFLDPGGSLGGPRAFLDSYEAAGGVTTEYMFEGGILPTYSTYWTGHFNYDYSLDDWSYTNWRNGGPRTTGEHSYKVGLAADGKVDVFFDNVFLRTYAADICPSSFQYAYLGVTSNDYEPSSLGANGTYTDFSWGEGYSTVPEPSAIALLAVAGLCLVLRRRRSS